MNFFITSGMYQIYIGVTVSSNFGWHSGAAHGTHSHQVLGSSWHRSRERPLKDINTGANKTNLKNTTTSVESYF